MTEKPFVKSYQLSQYLASDRTIRECISGLERSRWYLVRRVLYPQL